MKSLIVRLFILLLYIKESVMTRILQKVASLGNSNLDSRSNRCKVGNCIECVDEAGTQKCIACYKKMLNPSSLTCIDSPSKGLENCLVFRDAQCTVCEPGFFLARNEDYSTHICKPLPDRMKVQLANCQYTVQITPGSIICSKCNPGYFLDAGSNCFEISSSLRIPNCSQQAAINNSIQKCIECEDNYTLDSNLNMCIKQDEETAGCYSLYSSDLRACKYCNFDKGYLSIGSKSRITDLKNIIQAQICASIKNPSKFGVNGHLKSSSNLPKLFFFTLALLLAEFNA